MEDPSVVGGDMTGTYGNNMASTYSNNMIGTIVNDNYFCSDIHQVASIDCNIKNKKTLKMKEELCLCSKNIWN